MEFKEFLEKLQNLKLKQTTFEFEEEEKLPEEILKELEDNFEIVSSNQDADKHRWYETSTTVYKDKDGNLFGINGISDLFSEQMDISDCFSTYEVFEMEEIPSVTYKKKN